MPRHFGFRRSTVTLLGLGSLLPLLSLGIVPGLSGCSSTVEGKGEPSTSTGGASSGGQDGAGGNLGGGDSGGTSGTGANGSTGGSTGTGANAGTGGSSGPVPPSCEDLPANCGENGNDDCCASIALDSEPFPMGRGETASSSDLFPGGDSDELPERTGTPLGNIRLDKYEVTVGRFRKFLEEWPGNHPVDGDGAHPGHPGSGWSHVWNTELDDDPYYVAIDLKCENRATWYDTPSMVYGDSEVRPINCVSWYYAFAFCAWDGGFLPSELDWEFAAAGGSENRLYPWGDDAPTQSLASYDCEHDGNPYCGDPATSPGPNGYDMLIDIPAVGMLPDGAGRFGHMDLAGGMAEWVIDRYSATYYTAVTNCTNCISTMPTTAPSQATTGVVRGGSWVNAADELRAASRVEHDLIGFDDRDMDTGFRCARSN